MANPVENFEFILKKHSTKRHSALYTGNKQHKKYAIKPEDVISSVSAQIKAIQVADTTKHLKDANKDLIRYKKSSFLPVNKLPLYEEASKHNTFDTQCVSNTQLIDIIEDVELIHGQKGMTQEFETSFSYTDRHNKDDNKHIDKDSTNENKLTKNRVINGGAINSCNSEVNFVSGECKFKTNDDCIHKNVLGSTSTDQNASDNFDNEDICRKDNDHINIDATGDVIFVKNNDLDKNKPVDEKSKATDFVSDEAIGKKTFNYKSAQMEVSSESSSQILNECIQIHVDTEDNIGGSPSPILVINKKVINKSKTPSPLVFNLDAFEKFENFAISFLETNDFEKAKHVINSQILGRELHVKTNELVELEAKDIPLSPMLRRIHKPHIQATSSKKLDVVTSETAKESAEGFDKAANTEKYNVFSETEHLEESIFNPTENQLFNPSDCTQISPNKVENEEETYHSITKQGPVEENYNNNKDIKLEDPKPPPSQDAVKINPPSFLNDEILFSSDEEDNTHKEYQDLPFTCALETTFYNQSDILDKTMYVGFQTASNRSIQICKQSFDKARSLLSGIDIDQTSVTELVKICDSNNKVLSNIEVKNLVSLNEVQENLVETGVERDEDIESPFVVKGNDNIDTRSGEYKGAMEMDIAAEQEIVYKDLVHAIEKNDSRYSQKRIFENNGNFDGFRTASNKKIKLSDKALARCKKVFQDIDIDKTYDAQSEIDSKDAVATKANFEDKDFNVDVDMKDLNELNDLQNNINDDILIQEFENIEMSLEDDKKIINDTGFVGFKTANNKNIVISDTAVEKTKNFYKDIDEAEDYSKDTLKELNTRLAADVKNNVDSIMAFNIDNKPVNYTLTCKTDTIDANSYKYKAISKKLEENISDHCFHTFIGFKTANNKKIEISKEALAKSENVFKGIESIDLNQIISNDISTNISKKDAYPNIPDFNQPSTSTAVFAGFKTGNNEEVLLSNESLHKVKNSFKDKDNEDFVSSNTEDLQKNLPKENSYVSDLPKPWTSKALFVGFKTANSKEIKISAEAVAKTKYMFNDIDSIEFPNKGDKHASNLEHDIQHNNKNITDVPKTNFTGFKKTNNKEIKISEAALAKTKNLFNDIASDVYEHLDINEYPIGKATKTFNRNKPALNKPDIVETTFKQKISTENNDFFQENVCLHSDKIASIDIFQGFKTASNKQVKISKEALFKTKNIFKDIDMDDNVNIQAEKTHSNYINNGKFSFEDTKDKFVDATHNQELQNKDTVIFKGFQTASNKAVTISESALAKSKNIFQDINLIENLGDDTKFMGKVPTIKKIYPDFENKCMNFDIKETEHIEIGNDFDNTSTEIRELENTNKSTFKGFQTASNKKVKISEKAVAKTMTLFQDIINIPLDNKEIIVTNLKDTPFKTANNQNIGVTKEALLKSKKVFDKELFLNRNIDKKEIIVTNSNDCAFKSANNQNIGISEEECFKDTIEVEKNATELNEKVLNSNKKTEAIILDTQVLNNFEESLYTEDFKTTPIKSKRPVSPILLCPRAKKRKKFETPYSQKAPKKAKIEPGVTNTHTKFDFDENYKKHKVLHLKDLHKYINKNEKIDPYLSKYTFDNLLEFEFKDSRNDLSYTNMTIDLLKEIFLDNVKRNLVPDGWIDNHLKLILWKLISYDIRFPKLNVICTARTVLNQLKYRYDRELYNAERPALRKILEKDDIATKTIVLCVVQVYEDGVKVNSVTNLTSNIELLLTDGWYCIKGSTDRMLAKLVYDRKIVVGTKIVTNGAELVNCEQGIAPWEDTSSVRLKLFGNSTRRARWDTRLGYHGNAAILSHLSAVNLAGGKVSRLRLYVTRLYPALYVEKFEDGSTVTRSERLEHLHQMKYEMERQSLMEKLYEEVEKEFSEKESQDSEVYTDSGRRCLESGSQIAKLMKKSMDPMEFRAQLTSSQSKLLEDYTSRRREKLLQDIQARVREKMEKNSLVGTRNVVPVMKIRVVGVEERNGSVEVTKGMMSIWKPNEAILEITKENVWIDVLNVIPTGVRYSEIQISAGRQSVFRQSKYKEPEKCKPYTSLMKRKCISLKDIAQNPTMPTEYNEIDTVGLIFLIDPSPNDFDSKKHSFQNIYVTDADKNMICVNFWGGLKKTGFENVLDTGQVIYCANLQKRAGNTRKSIPHYRVTEFTYFTKTPKNENARIILEGLSKIVLSLDRRKFCDDCVSLKNNYAVFKNINNENLSPYRPNNSDYNISKNKMFIDSPLAQVEDNLNLTGLDFESTFKQTDTQDLSKEILVRKRRVNDKINKLKMYGEPPPLSPMLIINKSKNALKSYKSPLLSNDSKLNTTTNRIQNSTSNLKSDSVAIANNTPQKSVISNLSETSPVLNRTYVKSINPIKLNFNQNNSVNDVIDHFAEEFDGSPPLSLD